MNTIAAGSRSTRLFRTAKAAAMKLGVGLIVPVLQVPLFLHFWPMAEYGEWLILAAIPAYLEYANIGLPSAASSEMVMRAARGDNEGVLTVFSALVMAMVVLLGAVCLLAGALVASGVIPLFGLSKLATDAVPQALALLVVYVAAGQFSLALTAGLNAAGANATTFKVFSFGRVAELTAIAVVLLSGQHAVGVAAAMVAVRSIVIGVQIVLVRMKAPWLTFQLSRAHPRVLKPLASGAMGYMGWAIGNALSLQGFIIVVGSTFGPAALVTFNTTRTLTRFASQILLGVNEVVFVETSAVFGSGDTRAYRDLHTRAVQATLWLGAIIAVCGLLLGPFVYRIWTLGRMQLDMTIFALLMLAAVCQAIWSTSSVSLSATNRHFVLSSVFVVLTGCALSVTALVGKNFSMAFPAAVIAFSDGGFAGYVIWRVLRTIGESPALFLRQVAKPPIYLLSSLPRFSQVRAS